MVKKRNYVPGEKSFSETREKNWTIEWNGNEGLDSYAYRTYIRAPFIQNITENSAIVIWRTTIPEGENPSDYISGSKKLKAFAKIYEDGTDNNFSLYQTVNPTDPDHSIQIRDVSSTYKYEAGVSWPKHTFVKPGNGSSVYHLNGYYYRPLIEFKVIFKNLKANTIYQYHIEAEGKKNVADNFNTNMVLAEKVEFKTAPAQDHIGTVKFMAMGDLGPGDGQPSYFYDVFDQMHKTAREKSPDFWLALGDLDNDTDGHPNAMDPFFFNVYNAYHNVNQPTCTNQLPDKDNRDTSVKAFRKPPYMGLLGGLPVYPTFGNHDICTKNGGSLNYWEKAYKNSFSFPEKGDSWCAAAEKFNISGQGFYYTYRYGKVIMLSLGYPMANAKIANGLMWDDKWGKRQKEDLKVYLDAIKNETVNDDVWLVVYCHSHGVLSDKNAGSFYDIFVNNNVNLVLSGHKHTYQESNSGLMHITAGTGGFGDDDYWWDITAPYQEDECRYPGFVFFEVNGDKLRYYKYLTHNVDEYGVPRGRNSTQEDHIESRGLLQQINNKTVFSNEETGTYPGSFDDEYADSNQEQLIREKKAFNFDIITGDQISDTQNVKYFLKVYGFDGTERKETEIFIGEDLPANQIFSIKEYLPYELTDITRIRIRCESKNNHMNNHSALYVKNICVKSNMVNKQFYVYHWLSLNKKFSVNNIIVPDQYHDCLTLAQRKGLAIENTDIVHHTILNGQRILGDQIGNMTDCKMDFYLNEVNDFSDLEVPGNISLLTSGVFYSKNEVYLNDVKIANLIPNTESEWMFEVLTFNPELLKVGMNTLKFSARDWTGTANKDNNIDDFRIKKVNVFYPSN